MGAFYGSVQVRGDDREAVRSALEKLARKGGRFLLGPPLNGWIGVYPDGGGQDFGVAHSLARKLSGELIATLVHDDDVFAYQYHRNKKCIDQYNSVPDYFGEIPEQENRDLGGRPETFAHLADDRAKFEAVAVRLARQAVDRDLFASELLQEFADALGIRNALTSYEYLKDDGDTEDVEGWNRFIHVPDLGDERARKRAARTAILKAKKRLIREGKLLAEHGGVNKGWGTPSPSCCPAPDGRGFLAAWSSPADSRENPPLLELHGPPWSNGPVAIPWAIGSHVYDMESSPSGRYLAVRASGKAALWDLADDRLVAETPQVRAVSCVGFMPDESAMLSASFDVEEGRIVLTPIGAGEPTVIPIARAIQAAAHPSGSWLAVADDLNRLLVVDVAGGRVLKTHFVGGRRLPTDLERGAMMQMPSASKIDVDAVVQQLRQYQENMLKAFDKRPLPPLPPGLSIEEIKRRFEDQIAKMREAPTLAAALGWTPQPDRGSERVFQIRFDPSGERLFLGTMGGARVYSWGDVLHADGDLRPALAVDTSTTRMETENGPVDLNGHIYSLALDPDRNHLLFAGLDGRVRRLDIDSGRSDVLLEPPGLPTIHRLALSRDRATLALISTADTPGDRSRNARAPSLQFWDYRALLGT